VLILGSLPAVAATPVKVRDRKGVDEVQPAASDGYLVWSQGRRSYLRLDDDPRVRLNPQGTFSRAATIDATTVVYQEVQNSQSNLQMYDALTGTRSAPPDGVNTGAWEAEPSLSGDWLLYTRFGPRHNRVILFDLATKEQRVLANLRQRTHYLVSDQVAGDWATWESCDFGDGNYSNCQVHRYRISTDHGRKIPNPQRQQYAAGITSDGTAYFISTGGPDAWSCGNGATLVRQSVGGSRKVIATLPDGIDSLNTFAVQESDGSVTWLFERLRCRRGSSGIYAIEDADTA
jgi:hypothetical protein